MCETEFVNGLLFIFHTFFRPIYLLRIIALCLAITSAYIKAAGRAGGAGMACYEDAAVFAGLFLSDPEKYGVNERQAGRC